MNIIVYAKCIKKTQKFPKNYAKWILLIIIYTSCICVGLSNVDPRQYTIVVVHVATWFFEFFFLLARVRLVGGVSAIVLRR